MKIFWTRTLRVGLLSTLILQVFPSLADNSSKSAGLQPISVSEASYMDLVDEINRLMEVRPGALENPEEARGIFERFEAMVRGLVKINDLETARKLADHARKLYPDQMRSAFLSGWVHGLSGNQSEAVDLLMKGLGEKSDLLPDPDHQIQSEIKTTLAGFLIDLGDPSEAVKQLDSLVESKDRGALVFYLAGLAHHHLGDAFQCSKAYREAMEMDESLATANDYLVHAWAEDKLKRPQRAEAILDRGIQRFPMEQGLYFNRASNHEVMGASGEAYLDYQMEILVGGEESAFTEEARKRIAKIASLQTKAPTPDKNLMNVVNYLRAREQLARVEPAKLEVGDTIQRQRDRTNSLLDKAIEGERNPHPFLIHLEAERRIETEDWDRAVEILQKAVKDYPGQVLFQIPLAQCYAKIGKSSESDELIRSAQLAAPNHWIVRETLGPSSANLTFEGLEDF